MFFIYGSTPQVKHWLTNDETKVRPEVSVNTIQSTGWEGEPADKKGREWDLIFLIQTSVCCEFVVVIFVGSTSALAMYESMA